MKNNFVKNEHAIQKNKVFLLGRSLGGAVALHTVYNHPTLFRGVIIENSFTSLPDMVDVVFFFLKYFKFLVLRNYWRSIDIVNQIKNPMLFITGN